MVYLSIFFLIILAFIFGRYFLKNRSKISDINNHKNDYYGPDLELFNLSEDNYYAFEGSYRRSAIFAKFNKQEPIKVTIFRDETGNPHFAISYIDSGKYEVGEMNNETYDYSDPKIDQLEFEWIKYKSNGELESDYVRFQRSSQPKKTAIRCLIDKQFEFKGKMELTQDYVVGVQLNK